MVDDMHIYFHYLDIVAYIAPESLAERRPVKEERPQDQNHISIRLQALSCRERMLYFDGEKEAHPHIEVQSAPALPAICSTVLRSYSL